MNPNSAQLIHSMLVPGIFILAASILLFSTNSRYSTIVDRIRLLKSERGRIIDKNVQDKTDMNDRDKIELQISHLIHRIAMIRITIVSYSTAVLFFAVSCVLISIKSNFAVNSYFWVTIGLFFAGLLSIINGVIFSVIEVFKAYRIVHIEISEISQQNTLSP